MASKLTTGDFIQKAIKIHGDRYDYSKVEYKKAIEKVIIICQIHGEFEQLKSNHLAGKGCNKCGGRLKSNTTDFIQKAVKVHDDKFDYSKVNYTNAKDKVIIICKLHGEFTQTPNSHLRGRGCIKCGGSFQYNTTDFIEKAKIIHGDKYDYSKVDYVNNTDKIIIICKVHGEFTQQPNNHLQGKNCNKCTNHYQLNTQEFIEKAIQVHGDKYDYSKVNYTTSTKKVIIICKTHGEFEQNPTSHLSEYGCSKCSNNCKNIDTKYFIDRAIEIHDNKYDYSKVEYIKCDTKIIIICKQHGEFEQTPSKHLSKSGCQKCGKISASNKTKSNNKDFIKKAILIHKDKYDYSKTEYTKAINKIIIICKIHGEFTQTPNSHLNNSGCPKCCGNLQSNTVEFIEKAILIHKDKYDYSKVDYINNSTKVIIICKEHKEFFQNPDRHLSGSGCSKCSKSCKNIDTEYFIERAKKIHGELYDYSKVNYITCNKKVIIICKDHGEFLLTPSKHLSRGDRCQKCYSKYSKSQIIWLELLSKMNNIYIQHALNIGEFKIPNTNFKADGYCKETNTIYEFHGDYWHGNPKIFGANDINKTCNMTHGELYEKTLNKEQIIKDLGYNLVVIWESDWSKINKSIKILQKKFKNNNE